MPLRGPASAGLPGHGRVQETLLGRRQPAVLSGSSELPSVMVKVGGVSDTFGDNLCVGCANLFCINGRSQIANGKCRTGANTFFSFSTAVTRDGEERRNFRSLFLCERRMLHCGKPNKHKGVTTSPPPSTLGIPRAFEWLLCSAPVSVIGPSRPRPASSRRIGWERTIRLF